LAAGKLVADTSTPEALSRTTLEWFRDEWAKLTVDDQDAVRRGKVEVILPGLAPAAAVVLAAVHGLAGHFVSIRWYIRNPDGSWSVSNSLALQPVRITVRNTSR